MSKKKSIYDSGTTKGSAPRTSDKKKYDENWEKIFGKKKKEKKDKWNFYWSFYFGLLWCG